MFQEGRGPGFLEAGRRKWECVDTGDTTLQLPPKDAQDQSASSELLEACVPASQASTSGVSLPLALLPLSKHLNLVEHPVCFYCSV